MTKTKNFNEQDLLRASETLKAHDNWSVMAHRKADGDAIGSVSALITAGLNAGKRVKWFGADPELPVTYSFLPHYDRYIYRDSLSFDEPGELYIFLDCSNENRGVQGFDVSRNINSLNIDHHGDNTLFARENCVDSLSSSTAELLFRVLYAGSWEITKQIAECLYTGIFTDSGGFTFSNTSALTHLIIANLIESGVDSAHITDFIIQNKTPEIIKLWTYALPRLKLFGHENIFAVVKIYADDFDRAGTDTSATTGLPNFIMTLRGVKLIATVTENPARNGEVFLSFRSREQSPVTAWNVASFMGGGGHQRAAGATLKKANVDEAASRIEAYLLSHE
ncbi:MAG: DHH family phosphoesterase [Synergistaceae bacterium]|nr:DHH family phosphoesterase [Synergistaceae bacterium]